MGATGENKLSDMELRTINAMMASLSTKPVALPASTSQDAGSSKGPRPDGLPPVDDPKPPTTGPSPNSIRRQHDLRHIGAWMNDSTN